MAAAQEANPPGEQYINVSADRLVAETGSDFAEFIGNVRVVQGETTITADRLRIEYLRSNSADANSLSMTGESIRKLTAQGSVNIRMDDQTASTDKAEYDVPKRVLVLSGKETRVTSGQNTISGAKITMHRDSGQISVEGHGKQQVQAVFYSPQGGLK